MVFKEAVSLSTANFDIYRHMCPYSNWYNLHCLKVGVVQKQNLGEILLGHPTTTTDEDGNDKDGDDQDGDN